MNFTLTVVSQILIGILVKLICDIMKNHYR